METITFHQRPRKKRRCEILLIEMENNSTVSMMLSVYYQHFGNEELHLRKSHYGAKKLRACLDKLWKLEYLYVDDVVIRSTFGFATVMNVEECMHSSLITLEYLSERIFDSQQWVCHRPSLENDMIDEETMISKYATTLRLDYFFKVKHDIRSQNIRNVYAIVSW